MELGRAVELPNTVVDELGVVLLGIDTGVTAGDGVGGMDWLLAAIELAADETDPNDEDKSLELLEFANILLPFAILWSIEFSIPLSETKQIVS